MGITGGVRIWLLGGFRAERDGVPVPEDRWRRNRARAVVKLLALAPGHHLHREQLMDTLWPELDAGAEGANLRKAIHFARGALAPEHLRLSGEVVSLEASPLWLDIDAFDAAAASGRGAEAIALYGGDLLPEDRFESWSEDPRERLRARFHGLLLEVADERVREGQPDAAAEALERLIASDPLHEEAHLALMQLESRRGARHLALRRYRQFETRLRDELAIEPGAAIRRLNEAIVAGRFPPAGEAGPTVAAVSDEAAESTAAERPSEEARKVVTVLWADPVARTGDPELTRRGLQAWGDRVRAVLDDWGGNTEAQAGGSLVAVFGIPSVHEDDAARALRAGLEIVARAPLPTRIGIATGEVIAKVGPTSAPRTVAGEVMTDADRLREAARPGTVLVSERSRRAAGDAFQFARGLAIEVGADRLAARQVLAEHRHALREPLPESTLIGREAELSAVLALFADAMAARRPRLVLLVGAAGVGKSRLIREVTARLSTDNPGTRILRGRCLSAGRGAVYWALGEVLREACGLSLGDSVGKVRSSLRDTVASLLDEVDPADVEATTFALATTAGIALPGNPLDDLPSDEVARRLDLAWPRFATACAALAPTLLVIEDVHWAGSELLEMVETIVGRSTGPLMVLLSSRPESREARPAPGSGLEAVSTIALSRLSDDQSEALLDGLRVGQPLETRLREQVLSRAEGNPFYLEQLALHLDDDVSGALPDTLQSLLAARLESVSLPERRVLQEAAVVGRTFWEEPLIRALGDERLAARLAALERRGFIVRRPASSLPDQAEFAFRHALLHDVAYDSLPRGRRVMAHAAVGTWLEEVAGDRVDEVVDLLAHHYAAAAAPASADLAAWDGRADREAIRGKALAYLVRAGDAARRRFATDRAVDLHRRALEISDGPGERLQALEALADDHESNYHGDLAATAYGEALELARSQRGGSTEVPRLCRKLGWMMAWNPGAFSASPDPADVETLIAEGLEADPSEAERAWLMLARGAAARLYRGSEPFGQGTRPDSRSIGDRIADVEWARATGTALGRDEVVVAGGNALGMLYGLAGRYADMLALARGEVVALGPQDSRLDHADAIRKLAVHVINVSADFEEGLELGQRSRALSGHGGPHQVMHSAWPILVALFHLGRLEELLPILDEHVAAFRSEPAVECQFVRDGPAIGAAALTLLGRRDEARDTAALLGDPLLDRPGASAWQSRYATLSGDPATARAISFDKALEGRTYGPQHAFALLEALTVLEDWDAALAFLPDARRAVPGNALLGPMADRVEGQALLAEGDLEGGSRLLRGAVAAFGRMGAVFEERRSLEALRIVDPDRSGVSPGS